MQAEQRTDEGAFADPKADHAVNLAVLEGVGQIFQHRLFKGLVPQREVLTWMSTL